jgi:acetyltransferase-like isoleucine patch superfamily enzyme
MSVFKQLTPGEKLEDDWFDRLIPENIVVGANSKINTSRCFVNFYSQLNPGLQIGDNCVFHDTSFAVEENGFLEVGSNCFISNASLVVSEHMKIGNDVFIAGGVTIVDSNFHPLDPALRMADIKALSPGGNRSARPKIDSQPVIIGNNVWIGYNATIMAGIHIGDGAVIEPGSVVIKSIKENETVSGNPAKSVL